jgi:hypothetical protein
VDADDHDRRGFAEDCAQTGRPGLRLGLPVAAGPHGLSAGFLEPPDGFDPGTPRPDTTVTPVRFFVPTSWQLDVTT